MKDTEDFWKIFNSDKSVMILTDCPNTFKDGDGVYFLMKHLQPIFGSDLNGFQKFDERFDKIEDFDIILRTGYNLDGNRLISVHLFEYDRKKNELTVDRGKPRRIEIDYEYTYQIRKTLIRAVDGWDGLRKHILWTMGDDSCYRHFGDSQFGTEFINNFK